MLFGLLLMGCNQSTTGGGSYQSILYVNESEFYYVGTAEEHQYDEQFTVGEKIGEVKRKISPDNLPNKHLVSNYVEKGTVIYLTVENKEFLLADNLENGELELFTLQKNIESEDEE